MRSEKHFWGNYNIMKKFNAWNVHILFHFYLKNDIKYILINIIKKFKLDDSVKNMQYL